MTVIAEFHRPCGCWEHVSAFHRCADHVAPDEATDGVSIGCYEPNKIDAAVREREIREAVLTERESCAKLLDAQSENVCDDECLTLLAATIRKRR